MTACMENRKETVRSKLLTSRRPTTIATWNVRTMYAGGKAAVIAEEMKRYGISLLGLGETRWLQSGQVKLASGETILYSGHPEDSAPHTEGVAFMLSKEAQRALISWEPINSRIITAKFQTTHKKINLQVIQCYAPTNDTDDETKDQFYNQLYTILQDRKGKDIIILMGDMNAKIGGNNNGFEPVMVTRRVWSPPQRPFRVCSHNRETRKGVTAGTLEELRERCDRWSHMNDPRVKEVMVSGLVKSGASAIRRIIEGAVLWQPQRGHEYTANWN
ncbi:hypothetical protein NHX12_014512 [Muraenolepis orangiensis]|uniref:CIDE-N domain-containing protein n=1 Tax=Muraenolepis orangiensis TaxID=630683 RepID=A0A9Q0DBJ7_9TELE|nr:hypothetical protein NHX12_014512 [Muraenolepis orangiensis]